MSQNWSAHCICRLFQFQEYICRILLVHAKWTKIFVSQNVTSQNALSVTYLWENIASYPDIKYRNIFGWLEIDVNFSTTKIQVHLQMELWSTLFLRYFHPHLSSLFDSHVQSSPLSSWVNYFVIAAIDKAYDR